MNLYILLGIAGVITIMTSVMALGKGNFFPLATLLSVGFVLFLTYKRLQVTVMSQAPPGIDKPYDVFRVMESKNQILMNPWVGFIQEDIYENKTGPVGTFVGNDDFAKKAPLYLVT